MLPLPNTFGSLWVNFNSPLLWDVFAITTYFTVSLVFWYIGLIPDFATIRDRAKNKVSAAIYGALSFGWSGAAKDWSRYESVSLILAGLASEFLDGFIARLCNWTSYLGQVLDPIADKLFVLSVSLTWIALGKLTLLQWLLFALRDFGPFLVRLSAIQPISLRASS